MQCTPIRIGTLHKENIFEKEVSIALIAVTANGAPQLAEDSYILIIYKHKVFTDNQNKPAAGGWQISELKFYVAQRPTTALENVLLAVFNYWASLRSWFGIHASHKQQRHV